MENSYGTDLGLQNRFDALMFDTSVDPLEAISKAAKKRSKKIKQKKDFAQDKIKSKAESDKAQTKSKEPQVQGKKSEKSIKGSDKPAAKPAKLAKSKSAVSEPDKSLKVAFERLLTLDEYREANKGSLCRAPQYNLRQPGEGEDPSQWGKLVPLVKKKYQQQEEQEVVYEPCELAQRAGRLRRLRRLPVRVTFGDSLEREATKQRDLTAGAAAAAAPASASAGSAPLQRQRPPKVDNEREFPTLGY